MFYKAVYSSNSMLQQRFAFPGIALSCPQNHRNLHDWQVTNNNWKWWLHSSSLRIIYKLDQKLQQKCKTDSEHLVQSEQTVT